MQGISVVAVSLVMLDRCGVVMHYITSLHQQSRSTNAIRILLIAATCVSSWYAQPCGGTGAGVRSFTSVFKLPKHSCYRQLNDSKYVSLYYSARHTLCLPQL
jgi:hypothetical protein